MKKKTIMDDSESSDLDEPKNKDGGVTLKEFKDLKIPEQVMKDGMLFIWVEKEFISQIIKHLENMNFFYVENVCYVMINREMEKGKSSFYTLFGACTNFDLFFNTEVRQFATIDATPAMILEDFTYLKKSHKSLLMFRRMSKDGKLELRH